jgi:Flp pilus assembly protein TadD
MTLLRSAPPNQDLTLDLAHAYIGLKMLERASKVLEDSLAKNPSSVPLTSALISVHLKQFHSQAAEKLCAEAVKKHPFNPDLQRLYLQVLVITGNSTVAAPLAKKLLAGSPEDFEFLYINGVLEHDTGDSKTAREHLEHAVRINPTVAAAHFHLGIVLSQLGDPTGAKEQLQQALKLGTTEPEVHFELGKVLRALGDNQEAATEVKTYQQGLLERNHHALAASKSAQGDKAMSNGKPQEAIPLYREALDNTPDDALLDFKLAVALDQTGDIASERTLLEKAIQLNPDLASAQNQLGFLASRSGDSATAEKHFREAVRSAPGFTEAWVNLAASLGLQSRFSEAQEAVQYALQLEPKNPQALLLKDTLAKALAEP